jgi:cell wall-associated NlpC family hydrolase
MKITEPAQPLKFASLLLALLLAGCASSPPPRMAAPALPRTPVTPPLAPGPNASADLAFRALGLVGTPYRSAGSDPAIGFDCSGFVVYVYRDVLGMQLPRTTAAQYDYPSRHARREKLATGDLVFFDTSGRGVSHVGIYVGEGRFVHAPNHGGRVRLDRLDDRYWQQRYLGARRVLR